MDTKDFYVLFEQMFEREKETMVGKGKEYTIGNDDKLYNFKQVGEFLGIDPIKVLAIYWLKHIFSIVNYIKDGVESSDEGISGRIMDARNYLALLEAIIQERKEQDTIEDKKMEDIQAYE